MYESKRQARFIRKEHCNQGEGNMMEQEGFKVGTQAIICAGADITSENGTRHIESLPHRRTIVIEQLLDRHGDQTLLVCWRQNGIWHEAKAEDCTPAAP